eukprot:TRINITY_DN13971_c0_g1_i1.p1 TRINITY_DN13971_c0_g1~~TRINITY_DN13971_c0_g1_i1.p1  ORF type:complete len:244 (-),score=67.77 TRINITY_DN13971_c0_g1_i1:24-722(-)
MADLQVAYEGSFVTNNTSRERKTLKYFHNNSAWRDDKSRFGYRMLQNMGWSEGKGLGVTEQGMTAHLSQTKKITMAGVGADANNSRDWQQSTFDFDQVLTKLSGKSDDVETNPLRSCFVESEKDKNDESDKIKKKKDKRKKKKDEKEKEKVTEEIPIRKVIQKKKFTRSRITKEYQTCDLSEVLARPKSQKDSVKEEIQESCKEITEELPLVKSVFTMDDYFKQKKLKAINT